MSRPHFPDQRGSESRRSGRAFTLVELLTACAVLSILTIVMVSIVGKGSELWSLAESQSQHRQRARAMLEFAASELRQAVIPIDGSATSLQLVVNPSTVSQFSHHDSVFWQAPVATDSANGDLAEVGYFVRWNGTRASLCRFFVNPSDSANYLVHSSPTSWVTDSLLDAVAPADAASNYKGLFLENVLGLWVKLYKADGTAYDPADSRASGKLPAYAELTLSLVDSATAERVTASEASGIQGAAKDCATAELFKADSRLPGYVRNKCSTISTMVNFDNCQ